MKTKTFNLILVFLFFLCPFFSSATALDLDKDFIKIGVLTTEEFTTIRAQSFSGHWKATFIPILASETSEASRPGPNTRTTPIVELVAEGEDLAVSLTRIGLIGKISTGKEISQGYERIILSGGELLNIEIPGQQPILIQGQVEIFRDEVGLIMVNHLSFHRFLVSTVSRFGISTEVEALKSFIVMTRTRLKYLKENSLHKDVPFDICDDDHCLPFYGAGQNRELVDILVTMTANKIMEYKNKKVFPRFHNTCGGKISSAKDIFGTDQEPYHAQIEDRIDNKGSENCFHSPGFHWSVELSKYDLLEFIAFSWAGGTSRIFTGWEPLKIENTGRITRVLLRGKRPKEIDGLEFFTNLQSFFGVNSLKSMRFSMDVLRRSIIFRGMGQGLGVGMCIYGADGLAKKGRKYKDILGFYYPGTFIK